MLGLKYVYVNIMAVKKSETTHVSNNRGVGTYTMAQRYNGKRTLR